MCVCVCVCICVFIYVFWIMLILNVCSMIFYNYEMSKCYFYWVFVKRNVIWCYGRDMKVLDDRIDIAIDVHIL